MPTCPKSAGMLACVDAEHVEAASCSNSRPSHQGAAVHRRRLIHLQAFLIAFTLIGQPLAETTAVAPDPADTIRFSFLDNQGVLGTFVINASYKPEERSATWCTYPLEAVVEFDYLDFAITGFYVDLYDGKSKLLFHFSKTPSTDFNFNFEGRDIFDSLTTNPDDYVFLDGLVYTDVHGMRTFPHFVVGTFDTFPYINPVPRIVYEPVSIWPCEGEFVGTSVYAEGPNLSYQWYLNNTLVTSATTSEFAFRPATMADNGSTVFVIVSNSSGADTSQRVSVNVSPRSACFPTITGEPVDACVCEGDDAVFSVDFLNSRSTRLQWYSDTGPLPNETGTTLTITNAQVADSSTQFYVILTNDMGAVTSRVATLTVAPSNSCDICYALTQSQRTASKHATGADVSPPMRMYDLRGRLLEATNAEHKPRPANRCSVVLYANTQRCYLRVRVGAGR